MILDIIFWVMFIPWWTYSLYVAWNRLGPKLFFKGMLGCVLVGFIAGLLIIWLGKLS